MYANILVVRLILWKNMEANNTINNRSYMLLMLARAKDKMCYKSINSKIANYL